MEGTTGKREARDEEGSAKSNGVDGGTKGDSAVSKIIETLSGSPRVRSETIIWGFRAGARSPRRAVEVK